MYASRHCVLVSLILTLTAAPSPHAMDIVEEEAPKPQTKPPGPGDEKTDPRCMQLLPGHKSEVFYLSFQGSHV